MRKRQLIEKSSDGLFRYYNRVVIPRPTLALIKALLVEYHDNVGHPNYRRLMASLLKRFWWDKMTFDCNSHCQRCIVCNRAKPDRRGGVALQPLGILEYPWEIVGIDYVTGILKSGIDGNIVFYYGLSPYENGSLCSMSQGDHKRGISRFVCS